MLGHYHTSNYTYLQGTLDSDGQAHGSLTVPSGLHSVSIGNTFFVAATANQPGLFPEFTLSVNAITIWP